MKKIILALFAFTTVFAEDDSSQQLDLAKKLTVFYNQILDQQSAIQKMNTLRPKIYIYTDFGGGSHRDRKLSDLQTSGEISSAAWKETLQQELYINDSALPLSPDQAALHLAKTFPLTGSSPDLRAIVVHVVDPGVGNYLGQDHPQPRSMILRKDGVLFIGPDNGTLSFVCPPGSIAGAWEIDFDAATALSGIDTKVGGTFHGRDLFSEVAFRIAAGIVSPEEIGTPYPTLELVNRTAWSHAYQNAFDSITPVEFESVRTDRFAYDANPDALFHQSFLLGIVQSSIYAENSDFAITDAKKLFLPRERVAGELIAMLNYKTGNLFVGPNDGLGSSFIHGFEASDYKIVSLSEELFGLIQNEKNNEVVFSILEKQPLFRGKLVTVDFLGDSVATDTRGRPTHVKAKIWVDCYGNIKTTVPSAILNQVRQLGGSIDVVINGIRKHVMFAETFAEVPEGQLFVYNGSTAVFGPNPHRSKRYVELTANGVFGQFGVDFFEKGGTKPQSGEVICLEVSYSS